jgi:hypothetical protein
LRGPQPLGKPEEKLLHPAWVNVEIPVMFLGHRHAIPHQVCQHLDAVPVKEPVRRKGVPEGMTTGWLLVTGQKNTTT